VCVYTREEREINSEWMQIFYEVRDTGGGRERERDCRCLQINEKKDWMNGHYYYLLDNMNIR
jgi:hypothetical protein